MQNPKFKQTVLLQLNEVLENADFVFTSRDEDNVFKVNLFCKENWSVAGPEVLRSLLSFIYALSEIYKVHPKEILHILLMDVQQDSYDEFLEEGDRLSKSEMQNLIKK